MRGNITKRGKSSWRIKYEGEPGEGGKRITRYVTVVGSKKEAEAKLASLLNDLHRGIDVDPSRVTVGEWLSKWMDHKAPRSVEVYQEISKRALPDLGPIELQKLKPAMVKSWLSKMRASGGRNGNPISGRTALQAYRFLFGVLADAVKLEVIARNPVEAVDAPKSDTQEVKVSRRLGHASPTVTLNVYAHLFVDGGDDAASDAVERMLRK